MEHIKKENERRENKVDVKKEQLELPYCTKGTHPEMERNSDADEPCREV